MTFFHSQQYIFNFSSYLVVETTFVIQNSFRLISYHNKQISMSSSEDRDIHGDPDCVGFVKSYTKVPLSTQQQEDEHSNMHETHSSWKQI